MIDEFRNSIDDSCKLRHLYCHCTQNLQLPGDYSDLLRMGVVYCMSALDKLIHDIVVYHMVEIYSGRRQITPKYLRESLTFQEYNDIVNASVPPSEIIFEQIIKKKFSYKSFMHPDKLADALSIVWSEQNKWQVISMAMGSNRSQVITELKNIYQRRNAIVHEADLDPSTNQKLPILLADSVRIEAFILQLGEKIYQLI